MNIRINKHLLFCVATTPIIFGQCCSDENIQPNVLLLIVDDLRPELSAFGQSHIISPNIDALAENGVLFNRSYCNYPVSGASRASFMTGLYGLPNRFITYNSRIDEEVPGIPSIAEHFKSSGYQTISIGKTLHYPDDGLAGWSESPFRPDYPNDLAIQENWRDYCSPELSHLKSEDLPGGAAGPAWECADVDDEAYCDGKTASAAVKRIKELSESKGPFFLGVGFVKPHLPFSAPKKYWDLYNRDEIELAVNPDRPDNLPSDAFHNWGELKTYTNVDSNIDRVDDEMATSLRHAYYASISYIDAQIGRVMAALEESGLADNTIVVLMSDHGWSLGEHNMWCKVSNFDNVMRAPLIISSPKHLKGVTTNSLASYVDLYPTLCDLTGLIAPSHTQGRSLRPILEDTSSVVNKYVFCRSGNGETIICDKYNYTEFTREDGTKESMMFDHESDPLEMNNIVSDEQNQDALTELSQNLQKFIEWRK